jgi:hypothetical protein
LTRPATALRFGHKLFRQRLAWQPPTTAAATEVVVANPPIAVSFNIDKAQLELGHDASLSHGLVAEHGTGGGVPGMTRMAPSGSMRMDAIDKPAARIASTTRTTSRFVKRTERR